MSSFQCLVEQKMVPYSGEQELDDEREERGDDHDDRDEEKGETVRLQPIGESSSAMTTK